MKIKNALKKKKVPILIASGLLLAGLVGGSYYLANKQDDDLGKTTTESQTTTDAEVQQNVEQKGEATASETTTTPTVVAEKPVVTTLGDVSLTIMKDGNQAVVSMIGPTGSYGVEKLVNGAWQIIESELKHSSIGGGSNFDIILSSDVVTHYRVFKLDNGARSAISGDTAITWQEILDKGILTVPLAR